LKEKIVFLLQPKKMKRKGFARSPRFFLQFHTVLRSSHASTYYVTKIPGRSGRRRPGTDVMIIKILSPKNLAKILAKFAQNAASFLYKKKLIITLVFQKNANFFAENRRKL
jgi:hypothetical protein